MSGHHALDETSLMLAERLGQLRAEKRLIADEEKILRGELLANMQANDTEVGLNPYGEPLVVLTAQTRRTVNRSKLEALYPEVFDSVVEEKVSVIVKVNDVPTR